MYSGQWVEGDGLNTTTEDRVKNKTITHLALDFTIYKIMIYIQVEIIILVSSYYLHLLFVMDIIK